MLRNRDALLAELEELLRGMERLVGESDLQLSAVHPANRASAVNLLHYLVLRRQDIRQLQDHLAELGLSSLGRTETHVLSGVLAVMQALSGLGQQPPVMRPRRQPEIGRGEGRRLLEANSGLLLGPMPDGRRVRIMVTMPPEAATDYALVRDLLVSGMNCMRINSAHDGEQAWAAMIRNLRTAERETGRSCKIELDLAGPKLRTGDIAPGPAVLKCRPVCDELGRVVRPASIWLTAAAKPEAPPAPADAVIPVATRWLSRLRPGDRIRFSDARGAARSFRVTEAVGRSRWAESGRTVYLVPGTVLRLDPAGADRPPAESKVGSLPRKPQALILRPGDPLVLTQPGETGAPAEFDGQGKVLKPACISVSLREFFDSVQPGQPVWFDDGKIGGVVTHAGPSEAMVEILHARPEGSKLRAEKGINVPETDLRVESFTREDRAALAFAARNADIVGYSFVRTEQDVRQLEAALAELGAERLSVVLKIETREAFENLPALLLAASARRSVGVMIARGDLAIECGYQRLAEVQEEILWISEAAHVPVIWATQVLETMAKTGTPSRSEITDAAMGERAECVMLNKGPYVVDAVRALDDILRRMEAHQEKKRSMLRRLGVAAGFWGSGPAPEAAAREPQSV